MKVGSTQFSFKYGDQLHMPYTIAILVSYLKEDKEINQNFTFLPTAVDRCEFDKYIELYKNLDILLCSCYIWNWEITQKFAHMVKKNNPKCLIIFGGPQIPERSSEFFAKYDYVDIFVHNEGEVVLKNIFQAYLNNQSYDGIKGTSTKNSPNWIQEAIIKDINNIPSPYINGVMWELIDKNAPLVWLGIMETVRGCPYACSYCAWGASSYNAVRRFNLDRVFKEIDFFSDNKLTYIDCSDANFGMLERDVQITDYIVDKKKTTGFPTSFKPCWDKKSNDRIKYIAKALKSVNLLISVGCSLQTLGAEALKVNNRKSVSFEEFIDLTNHYKKDGSQSYTELIRGLPGETLDTFIDGLNKIVYESNVDTVFIYNCSSYEATEVNSCGFKEKYKVEIVRSPIFLSHATLSPHDIIEYDDIIISSYSFTTDDLKKMYLYSWYMLTFQFLGVSKYITKHIHDTYRISYKEIYDHFVKYCENNPNSLFGKEYHLVVEHGTRGFSGQGWDHIDPNLGPINWPIEEASFLRLTDDTKKLKVELKNFIDSFITSDDRLEDLVNFQVYTISNKENTNNQVIMSFGIDWKEYFTTQSLVKKQITYSYKNKISKYTDNFDWNTKCIWHGRRKVNYKAKLEEIEII